MSPLRTIDRRLNNMNYVTYSVSCCTSYGVLVSVFITFLNNYDATQKPPYTVQHTAYSVVQKTIRYRAFLYFAPVDHVIFRVNAKRTRARKSLLYVSVTVELYGFGCIVYKYIRTQYDRVEAVFITALTSTTTTKAKNTPAIGRRVCCRFAAVRVGIVLCDKLHTERGKREMTFDRERPEARCGRVGLVRVECAGAHARFAPMMIISTGHRLQSYYM